MWSAALLPRRRRSTEALSSRVVALLRGARDFDSRGKYEVFLRKVVDGRNRGRWEKYAEELAVMGPLPLTRLSEHRTERIGVSVFSTIRAANNVYSVPSRPIGERVEVRPYAETVEVFYAGERVCAIERLRGSGNARIDYRHLIVGGREDLSVSDHVGIGDVRGEEWKDGPAGGGGRKGQEARGAARR